MTRSSILRLALPFVGALCFVVACGPRMKPVEYEEPSNDLSSNNVDDASGTSSANASTKTASSGEAEETSAKPQVGGACKEKKCGDTCSECPPGDESCMEILVLKQCNAKGECVPAKVECSASDKNGSSKDDKKSKK
ncbi:MAG: hypothetical protein QM784_38765 [Polyangiaceae bacterium]